MVKLVLGNSFSSVQGLSKEQEQALRKALSYTVPDHRGPQYPGRRKCLLGRRGDFPTGLLGHVQKVLGVGHEVVDTRVKPSLGPLCLETQLTLRLPKGLAQDQLATQRLIALEAMKANRGTVVMPTGTGKSITMAVLVNQLQLKTLIVVPNLTLKLQLTESFREMFGSTPYIRIENIDSSALDTLTGFDVLIIDEAHHVAASTYRNLNKKAWKGIYYRYFFTATPFRTDAEEQLLMESLSGEVVYSLSYKEAVRLGFIVPVEAYYIELPKVKVKGKTWAAVYKELVTGRGDRNAIIREILLKLHVSGVSTLCLVKEIDHGHKLTHEGAFAFANGKDEGSRQILDEFAKGTRKVIVATEGVAGEGADTKACEWVIIAGLGKSKPAFMQKCGRAVRRFPGKDSAKILLVKDSSHKWTKSHFEAQVKILKEEFGVIPVRLEYA